VRRVGRLLGLVAIVALLVATAYVGLVEGLDARRSAATIAQRTASVLQLLYGGCAVVTLAAMTIRRSLVRPLLVVWGAALTAVGAMAPVVYGGASILAGVAGGVMVAAVVAAVLWGWRRAQAAVAVLVTSLLCASRLAAQTQASFPTSDGGTIVGDLYGFGARGVVLAHGGRFDKESWTPQARVLAASGFRVLALDFRGYGPSRGPGQEDPLSAPLVLDVLGAVGYLRQTGAKTVAIVGASMGGAAAANAAARAGAGEIDRLVLLASDAGSAPDRLTMRKLFVLSRDDLGPGDAPRLPKIRVSYERCPDPKEWIVLEGSAHAQFIFQTAQGTRLLEEILRFLLAP
jgi:alpha/beta superfamily hydrolase